MSEAPPQRPPQPGDTQELPTFEGPPSRERSLLGRTGTAAAQGVRATGRGVAAVSRAGAARVDELVSEGGDDFRALSLSHAGSTMGDTLVAIALAGTLFFAVPTAEARENVALYLLLTVAPFAIIGPLLGLLLDRRPSAHRAVLIASSLGRAVLAAVLATQQDTIWLFPLAFGLLVLSRAHGIARMTIVPQALDGALALVKANARLAQVGVLAGAVVVPFGLLAARFGGAGAPLVGAAATFVWSALAGRDVPVPQARPPSRADEAFARGGQLAVDPDATRELPRADPPGGSLRIRLPHTVRLAQLATAMVRLLNGFLVLLLAFAFRDAEVGALDFGAVLGAAALGFGLSSLLAPRLEVRLREEPMVVAGLAVEAAAAFIAGQWFGLPAAAALALAAGLSWGTAKFAFDGLLQASVRPERRGSAFTRSETVFQLAWVLGAVVPTALTIPIDVGLVLAGLTALTSQVVYVAHLLSPLRDELGREPEGDARDHPPGGPRIR